MLLKLFDAAKNFKNLEFLDLEVDLKFPTKG
jgi:hypothetical protein